MMHRILRKCLILNGPNKTLPFTSILPKMPSTCYEMSSSLVPLFHALLIAASIKVAKDFSSRQTSA